MTTEEEVYEALKYRIVVGDDGTVYCLNNAGLLHCDNGRRLYMTLAANYGIVTESYTALTGRQWFGPTGQWAGFWAVKDTLNNSTA